MVIIHDSFQTFPTSNVLSDIASAAAIGSTWNTPYDPDNDHHRYYYFRMLFNWPSFLELLHIFTDLQQEKLTAMKWWENITQIMVNKKKQNIKLYRRYHTY